jgi:hypothetical protein
VVATGVELKTDDAALGATIGQTQVAELPTLNRNFASLLVLTPGVQFGTRMGLNAQSTASSFFPGATQVSANGQRDANQRVTLDGVIASDPLVNTVSESLHRRHRRDQDSDRLLLRRIRHEQRRQRASGVEIRDQHLSWQLFRIPPQ